MTATSLGGAGHHLVGVLGGARTATVDERGMLGAERALWRLEWWVGADDRWHLADREAAVRQSLVDDMPVVRTAMKVPGGDAVHEVFGATADAVVVDVENASPAPFVAAFVVRGASIVALDDATVLIDNVPALTALRPPSRWAVATDGTLSDVVTRGDAHNGPMPLIRDRAARVDAAFMYPVAHRTRFRLGVALGRHDTAGLAALDLTAVADADSIVRGWRAQLDRGMRVVLPDPRLQSEVDAARAQVLLAGQAWRADAAVVAALEDWGFDDESVAAWQRLGMLERRRARRRAPAGDVGSPAALLVATRRRLLVEDGPNLELLPELPAEWRGQPIDVRTAPTRLGPVSFSVRWHGPRAALLWEIPPGATARVHALDASWSTSEPRGETLLGPVE